MSQKKEGPESTENKPGVKIQDLSPKKDAKGGGGPGKTDQNRFSEQLQNNPSSNLSTNNPSQSLD